MKNLENLNNKLNLDSREVLVKEVLNIIVDNKNKYDGVWLKMSNNNNKNKVEKILIKTYGDRHSIGILLNNSGYIINKYNLSISKKLKENNMNFIMIIMIIHLN